MKRIILITLALTIISSIAYAENESIFIPGLSKKQSDEKRQKAIDAANSAISSQESNEAVPTDTYRPYQHKPNYRPPTPLQPSGYGAPAAPTYSPPNPPSYNPK